MQKVIITGLLLGLLTLAAILCSSRAGKEAPPVVKLSKQVLEDKIKGGWAGQTIGCTYGGPFEFRFNGTMIQDYVVPAPWDSNSIKWWYDHAPGLYDDVYMDLTFVKVFDKYGLDAPVDSFANAFAYASYPLWHANQAARFNLLNGLKAPQSGHWMHNPHADDIDFQIESDFAGLMSPAMVNTAGAICDSIGHIMNYGDGWYGGVYVAAMYALAFTSNDINQVVTEALKVIPEKSKYRRCMESVIANHKKYPDDWKRTWFEVQRNWSEDLYCPEGVYVPFDIDAALNSAYVLIGLLYGQGDFTKTMDIAMRCGQDADCNPATVAGILGAMIGYKAIPEKYLQALKLVEDRPFAHTAVSLNELYKMSYRQALEVIRRNKGRVNGNDVIISYQIPQPVRLEQSFGGYYPVQKVLINKPPDQLGEFRFRGKGVVFRGNVQGPAEYVANVEMYIDGKLTNTVRLPVNFITRRDEMCYAFELPEADHTVTLKWTNADGAARLQVTEALVYGAEGNSSGQ
jgi:hypothetical protein